MQLIDHSEGSYQFLPMASDPRIVGGPPFSAAVKAMPGYEIVHVTFQRPLEYHRGFAAAGQYLASIGRPRAALCGVEVRVPRPLTTEEFAEFNVGYRALVGEWDIAVDGRIPLARSNVAQLVQQTSDILLYGFSFTVASTGAEQSFSISAAPEDAAVRPGETDPDAMQEKTASAMQEMRTRLAALDMDWADVTFLGIYSAHNLHPFLDDVILKVMGASAIHGVHWFVGPPPIVGIEVEIDVRAIHRELRM